MWKDGISCDIFSAADNIIHAVVRLDPSKPEVLISFMYGSTYTDPKKKQCNFMHDLSKEVFQPWLVIGDLNFHLDRSDNSTDSWVHNKVRDLGIMDIDFEGKDYTWTNNSFGTRSKRDKIELALGNNDWFINFSQAKLLHLNFIGSDHYPVLLITDPIPRNLWRPFKFFSTWINHESFRATMDSAWNLYVHGCTAFKLKIKQQSARLTLSQWNKMEFGDIHQNIKNIQIQLENAQSDFSSSEQISRVKALTKDLKNCDRSDISNILTEHFKNISTTSNPCFPDDAFDIIPAIFADVDNDFLIAMPTDDEIENVVKSMPAWSSPGPDGFQAGFYQTP
ncbi:uncharacterized protein LOC113272516 [Papaver somniferum]|uniref:uncharacterized protein LOC113272516 n=1 Tax=Papaver somniferum TaxID=3469 RepID=UPI000E702228|nr:uncharacterized protein LOC113272516 [Papaver somniferum]